MSDLVYQGVTIREDAERLNMTDAWRAAGSPENLTPYDWSRLPTSRRLLEHIADEIAAEKPTRDSTGSGILGLFDVRKGGRSGGGATWAHWKIVLAYAADLSPAFKSWGLDVIRSHMLGKLGTFTGQSTADIIVANHVANPSHFRSFVKLRDNRAYAHAMQQRLRAMASIRRISFNRAHGAFRRNFKVVSYLESTLDMYELGMDWILMHIDDPTIGLIPPPPANDTKQLTLWGRTA